MYREGGRISCIPRVSRPNRETWQVCVCDETHTTHSCYAAGCEKWCRLPWSEEHLFIYQGRQLCDAKQAPSVLVNFKLIGSPSGEPMFSLCRKWRKFAGHCKVT